MKKLKPPTRKKIKQFKRFFSSKHLAPNLERLLENLRMAGRSIYKHSIYYERKGAKKQRIFGAVFDVKIGRKIRTVKISADEHIQRANSEFLFKKWKEAVRRGIINPTYELHVPRYLYADKNFGVMERIPGPGCDTYKTFLQIIKNEYLTDRRGINIYKQCIAFWKKAPEINRDRLDKLKFDLSKDLKLISDNRKLFSFDLAGTNNILLVGYDRMTDKPHIFLVDQVWPTHGQPEYIKKLFLEGKLR